MHGSRLAAALAALIAALTLAACGGNGTTTAATSSTATPATFPVTVKAPNGDVTIPAKPTRIVSLSPTATEMVFALGAGPQVAAVDKYSDYPGNAPKTDLNGYETSPEAIAAQKPDLVLLASDPGGLVKGLDTLKIPTIILPAATTLEDAYAQISELGQATGHPDGAAKEVADIRSQLDAVVKDVGDAGKGVTYYHELDSTLFSATSKSFIGAVYSRLGMVNIADPADKTGAAYPQLSPEFVVKADPDFIFLADTVCCQQSEAKVAARPGFNSLKAVRLHHVVPINDSIASHWGPRIAEFLRIVGNALKAARANQPAA